MSGVVNVSSRLTAAAAAAQVSDHHRYPGVDFDSACERDESDRPTDAVISHRRYFRARDIFVRRHRTCYESQSAPPSRTLANELQQIMLAASFAHNF